MKDLFYKNTKETEEDTRSWKSSMIIDKKIFTIIKIGILLELI